MRAEERAAFRDWSYVRHIGFPAEPGRRSAAKLLTPPRLSVAAATFTALYAIGSSRVVSPRICSQLALAHDALVRLVDALYLIFKFAVVLRQSFDDDIRSPRYVDRAIERTRTRRS